MMEICVTNNKKLKIHPRGMATLNQYAYAFLHFKLYGSFRNTQVFPIVHVSLGQFHGAVLGTNSVALFTKNRVPSTKI